MQNEVQHIGEYSSRNPDEIRRAFRKMAMHIFRKPLVVAGLSLWGVCCTPSQYGSATPANGPSMPARLYSLTDGQVIPAAFTFAGSTNGEISIAMPNGEVLRGEYRTVPSGMTGWGAIFAQGGASAVAINSRSAAYRGTAIATGPQRTVMECEYVTSSSRTRPEGYGTCRDNQGRLYRLMF